MEEVKIFSNDETTNLVIKKCIGKKIKFIYFDNIGNHNDYLHIIFDNQTILTLWDNGQCCSESRYMTIDDDLSDFKDTILCDFEIKSGTSFHTKDYDTHEIAFLEIQTSKGFLQVATHNVHNGYYEGFEIRARINKIKE